MKQLSLFDTHSEVVQPNRPKLAQHYILSVDGASRNNPGKSGAGIVLRAGNELIVQRGYYLGVMTNNQAEYIALILGLLHARRYKQAHDELTIKSDSQLLVRQMQGHYRVKHPELIPLHACAQHLFNFLGGTITHVLRDENADADAMANEGIDKKVPLETWLQVDLAHYNLSIPFTRA